LAMAKHMRLAQREVKHLGKYELDMIVLAGSW